MKRKEDFYVECREPTAGEKATKYAKNAATVPIWGAAKITGVALRFSARVIHVVTKYLSIILAATGVLSLIFGIIDFGTMAALIGGAIGVSLVPKIIYALGNGASSVGDKVSDYWYEPPKIKSNAPEYKLTPKQEQVAAQDKINAEYAIAREKYIAMRNQEQAKLNGEEGEDCE